MICLQYNKAHYNKILSAIESEEISDDDLYIIKAGKYFKIGRTKNFQHRVAVFQTGCPYRITCVLLIRNKGFTERYLHFLMIAHIFRKDGEWFRDCGLMQKLIEDLKPYSKPRYKEQVLEYN